MISTWEDAYRRASWQGFLTALGYRKTAPATFVKKHRMCPRILGEAG